MGILGKGRVGSAKWTLVFSIQTVQSPLQTELQAAASSAGVHQFKFSWNLERNLFKEVLSYWRELCQKIHLMCITTSVFPKISCSASIIHSFYMKKSQKNLPDNLWPNTSSTYQLQHDRMERRAWRWSSIAKTSVNLKGMSAISHI